MAEKKKKRKPPKRSGEYKSYKVKKGDTLSKIADKNHVSLSDLLRWNTDIKDANKVSAGTHLRIPTIKEGLHPNVSLENRYMGANIFGESEYKGKDPRIRMYKTRTSGGIEGIPGEPDVFGHPYHASSGSVKKPYAYGGRVAKNSMEKS
tara:strand:+ start:1275 stop:1721 length:447 start_codon:yes stop_codon:yes gene_type:complete